MKQATDIIGIKFLSFHNNDNCDEWDLMPSLSISHRFDEEFLGRIFTWCSSWLIRSGSRVDLSTAYMARDLKIQNV